MVQFGPVKVWTACSKYLSGPVNVFFISDIVLWEDKVDTTRGGGSHAQLLGGGQAHMSISKA